MAKAKKYKLEIWVKDPARAIGIIDRLWAVGELTPVQRRQMIRKIDAKRLVAERERNKKFEKLFAGIRGKSPDSTAD